VLVDAGNAEHMPTVGKGKKGIIVCSFEANGTLVFLSSLLVLSIHA